MHHEFFSPISHLSLYPCDVECGAEGSVVLVDKGKTQMSDQQFFFKISVTLQVLWQGRNVVAWSVPVARKERGRPF